MVPLDSARKRALKELQATLGHVFADLALLEQALVHPSYGNEHGIPDYERLEFLGDAVVELVVSERLFHHLPEATEGRLSDIRKHLLEKDAHARAAAAWGVGSLLRLGRGEAQSGGAHKPGVLGDVFEAVVGALFLDGGVDACRRVLEPWMVQALSSITRVKDPKTDLQEQVQAHLGVTPQYRTLERAGPAHEPLFHVVVEVGGEGWGEGLGPSKRKAQREAALVALERLHGSLPAASAVTSIGEP